MSLILLSLAGIIFYIILWFGATDEFPLDRPLALFTIGLYGSLFLFFPCLQLFFVGIFLIKKNKYIHILSTIIFSLVILLLAFGVLLLAARPESIGYIIILGALVNLIFSIYLWKVTKI